MKRIFVMLLVLLFVIFINGFLFAAESGDVNSDGKVDIVDALMVAQY